MAALFYLLTESAKLVGDDGAEYLCRAAETAVAGGDPVVPADLTRAPECHHGPRARHDVPRLGLMAWRVLGRHQQLTYNMVHACRGG